MNKKFLNILILLLAAIIVLVIAFAVVNKDNGLSSTLPNNQQQEGQSQDPVAAPDFTLTDLEGNTVSLSDYSGQNVFLNFWASWCGPCRDEMPDMELIHKDFEGEVVILAVNVGENAATASGFREDYELTFKILLDEKNEVASLYGVTGIPTSYFIDKEGNIMSGYVGTMDYDTMESYIIRLTQ